MPRIKISAVAVAVEESNVEIQKAADVVLSLEIFIESLTDRITS
jgi:hypothetical protein